MCAMDVQVRLLGPVELLAADGWRPVAGLRRRAVLAALALRPGELVSTDRLIDAVWGEDAPATALNALQSHVSILRREHGLRDVVVGRQPGYVFDLPTGRTDVQLLTHLVRAGDQEPDDRRRVELYEAALGLWRGPALADVQGLRWFTEESVRLESVRRAVRGSLIEARLAVGHHNALVAELEHLCERHPFDEDLCRQLMLALYRSGRQGDALAAFHRLRRRLSEDLGIDPGPGIRALEASVLRHAPVLDLLGPGGHGTPAAGRGVAGGRSGTAGRARGAGRTFLRTPQRRRRA